MWVKYGMTYIAVWQRNQIMPFEDLITLYLLPQIKKKKKKKNPIFLDFFGQVWKAKILFPEKNKKKKNEWYFSNTWIMSYISIDNMPRIGYNKQN